MNRSRIFVRSLIPQHLFDVFQRTSPGFKDLGVNKPDPQEAQDPVTDKEAPGPEEVKQGRERQGNDQVGRPVDQGTKGIP